MATKTTSNTRYGTLTTSSKYWMNNKWVDYSNSPVVTKPVASYVDTVKTSTVTPFFRDKLRRPKPLPSNAYNVSRISRGALIGWTWLYTAKVTNEMAVGVIETPIMAPVGIDSNRIAQIEQETLYKFYGRMKDQKVNLAQVFAERNQAARLIGDSAIAIADSVLSFRKTGLKAGLAALGLGSLPFHQSKGAKRRGRKRVTKPSSTAAAEAAAQRWLELQYGWKPLLNDCFGAAEALAKGNLNLPLPSKVSSRSRVIPYERISQTVIPGLISTDDERGTYFVKYTCTFNVSGEVSVASSLGLTNPAYLAWELLPYSFVVDWFYNVGGLISSWDATIGCSFESGCKSVVETGDRSIFRAWIPANPLNGRSGYASGSSKREVFTRTKLTSFPSVPLPVYNDRSSMIHMANGLALLTSAFANFKK